MALFEGGVRDPCALLAEGDADGADRAVEGDTADHERCRSGVDADDVVRVFLVGAEDRQDDLCLIAVPVGERRPQRAVGQAAGEDCVLARAAFTTEECARDLAGSVSTLFDIDGEREEVDAISDIFGCVGGCQHGGPSETDDNCTLRLRGELAGLERERLLSTGDRC